MSSTRVFIFDSNFLASSYVDVANSFRGAFAVWSLLETIYLPKYLDGRFARVHTMEDEAMQEIWDLIEDKRLAYCERVVLATTFDRYLVRSKDFETLIKAMRDFMTLNENVLDSSGAKFASVSNLPEQIDVIESVKNKATAVAWNHTTVVEDFWIIYNSVKDTNRPYNLKKDRGHVDLFKHFKKIKLG